MTTQTFKTLKTNLMVVALAAFTMGFGCNGTDAKKDFRVSAVTPSEGDQGVAIDKTIHIRFTKAIDAATVNDESVTVVCDSAPVAGRILAHDKVVMFVPGQMPPNADCVVQVDADVADSKGRTLGHDTEVEFTTGETTMDGQPYVNPANAAPFQEKRYIHLTRQMEYALFGVQLDGSDNNVHLMDPVEFNQGDMAGDSELLHSAYDSAFAAGTKKVGAAGNLDADAFDEIVTLVSPPTGPAVLRVTDNDGSALAAPQMVLQIGESHEQGGVYRYSLSLADVDKDGYDEILVAGVNGMGKAMLWLFDDSRNEHKLLTNKSILGAVEPSSAWSGVQLLKVAAGNIDNDADLEIVLAMQTGAGAGNVVRLVTIDDLETAYAQLDIIDAGLEQTNDNAPDFSLVLADPNGDRIAEVVVARRQQEDLGAGGCRQNVAAKVYSRDGARYTEWGGYAPAEVTYAGSCNTDDRRELALHAIDINGDRKAEVLLETAILRWDDDDEELQQAADEEGTAALAPLYNDDLSVAAVAVGDVNGDARADVILLHSDASLTAWGLVSVHVGQNLDLSNKYESRWQLIDERGGSLDNANQSNMLLVPANVDGDSLIVKPSPAIIGSTGDDPNNTSGDSSVEHRIIFTKSRIINVLAAAPCYNEDWQGDCSTSIATSVGGELTAGVSFSVWTGVAVGFSQEVSAGLFVSANTLEVEAMVKTEIEASVWASATVGVEYEKSISAGKGEDMVTFFTIPHHQYVYTFASHPDSGAKGSTMTINVPMSARIFTTTVDYYNANNGTDQDIDETVLPHTAGEPDTYMSFGEIADHVMGHRLPLGTPTSPNQVSQGGSIGDSLSLSASGTVGGELKLSIEAEAKMCVAGVCVAGNQGVSFAAFAEVTLSSSTTFAGEVGGMDADHYADHLYSWGMFSYVDGMKDASGRINQVFTVVNYYVE